MDFKYKLANLSDITAIKELMYYSTSELLGQYFGTDQLEASFESMGLDDQLIKDKTYFLVISGKNLVGCGGWSYRRTLYGGNHTPNRSNNTLNPSIDPARIRAMYTHPEFTRKGIGSLILDLSESAAKKEGFSAIELMATLSGLPLYHARGYKEYSRENFVSSNVVILITSIYV